MTGELVLNVQMWVGVCEGGEISIYDSDIHSMETHKGVFVQRASCNIPVHL